MKNDIGEIMKICVVTGKETDMISNNTAPLSREGRPILKQIVERHNEKILEAFIEGANKDGKVIDPKLLKKIVPKVSTKQVLRGLQSGNVEITNTKNEVMSEIVE